MVNLDVVATGDLEVFRGFFHVDWLCTRVSQRSMASDLALAEPF